MAGAAPSKPVPKGPAFVFDESVPLPDDAVEVARVMGAWGVKGGLKVKPFSALPEALFSSRRWFVRQPEGGVLRPQPAASAGVRALPGLLSITQARDQGDLIVVTCQELADRDAAEAMVGARIFISRASFPTPEDNEFYWVDLIGMAVHNREGRLLGQVVNLIETGPHCVLCIQPPEPAADEVLIPFVDAYVDRVERDARAIHVDWNFDD